MARAQFGANSPARDSARAMRRAPLTRAAVPTPPGAPGADAATSFSEAAALDLISSYEGKLALSGEFAADEAATEAKDALGSHAAPRRRPRVELAVDDFLSRCPSSYVVSHGATPWLLRKFKEVQKEHLQADEP